MLMQLYIGLYTDHVPVLAFCEVLLHLLAAGFVKELNDSSEWHNEFYYLAALMMN